MVSRRFVAAALAIALGPAVALAQGGVREIRLDRPTRIAKEDFTRIAGAIELADGRVLVSDRSDERVMILDLAKATATVLSRAGSGPAEYRMPDRLIRWAADSVLLVDEGNDRLAIISPDLKITRSFSLRTPGVPASLVPRAVDAQGRMYAQVSRWAARQFNPRGDSVPILRLASSGTPREVIAWVVVVAEPAGGVKRGLPYIPFSPQDVWAADSHGDLIIARSGDYHVERISAGGVSRGPSNPFTPLPVSEQDKFEYTKSFLEHSSIGGKGGPAATPSGLSPLPPDMLTREAIDQLVKVNPFARVRPPFTDALPLLSVSGTFWVTRSVPLSERPAMDVFDRSGKQILRVVLPAGRRAIAVGRHALYTVAESEEGFERLEQYPIPD